MQAFAVDNNGPMEVPYAFLADSANYSQEGKINVLGIFNRLSAPKFPTTHPSMSFVMRLEASPAEAGQTKKVEIHIMDEDGKRLGTLSADLEIPQEESGRRTIIDSILAIKMFKFPHPGVYSFTVLVGGEPKKEVTLEIVQISSEGDD